MSGVGRGPGLGDRVVVVVEVEVTTAGSNVRNGKIASTRHHRQGSSLTQQDFYWRMLRRVGAAKRHDAGVVAERSVASSRLAGWRGEDSLQC